MEFNVTKQVKEGAAYYLVRWSQLAICDKYRIIKAVPAVAGLYELYYVDDHKTLRLFYIAKAWYGGLRTSIREKTDPDLVKNLERKRILCDHTCYYRYTQTGSHADMTDIIFFYAETYLPGQYKTRHSGRYKDIYVEEVSADKIVDI
jgi:hypothetical protein